MACIMACVWGGTGHYLVKDNVTNANVRADHTIMCRVKWTATATNESNFPAVLCTSAATSGGFCGRVTGDASTLTRSGRFSTTPTYNTVSNTGSYGDTTTWRHLAMVYNSVTQLVEYYLDGVSQGTTSSTTSFVAADTAGAFGILSKGKIADVALYSRALTAGEVLQMAEARALSVTSNCLGFYRLDTNSSGGTAEGNATDTSGSGNTLVATSAAGGTGFTYSTADNPPQPDNLLKTPGLSSASTLAGTLNTLKPIAADATSASTLAGALNTSKPIAGGATSADTLAGALVQTNATAGTATSATTLAAWIRPRWGRRIVDHGTTNLSRGSLSVATSAFTWMGWLRGLSLPTNGDLIAAQLSGTNFNSRLGMINASGTQSWSLRVFDGTSTTVIYGAAVDTAWHHATLTYDGTNIRAYADGSLVATTPITFAGPTATTLQVFTGNSSSGSYGELAHMKWWSTQLSAAEIVQEKDFYTPAHQTSSLVGWWQLGWQDVTLDSSGNGRTLTNSDSDEAQTESPGLPLTSLAGSGTSASTLAGAAIQSQALVGAATSASTLAGAAIQSQPLAASASSASTLSATLVQTIAIAGTATSASTLSAALIQDQPLAAAATSASTLAGAMVQNYALAGSATSASTLAGAATTTKPIAGDSFSASTLTGALIQEQALAAAATSASTFAPAALGIDGQFAGNLLSASTLAGELGTLKPIAADSFSASTLAGALNTEKPLAGDATSASTFEGALGQPITLVGDAGSSSTLVAFLGTEKPLLGDALSASTLAGAILQDQALVGLCTSASTLAASVSLLLVGGATSASTLAGAVDIAGPRAVAGSAFSASTLGGTLTGGTSGGGGGGNQDALRRMAALQAGRRRIR